MAAPEADAELLAVHEALDELAKEYPMQAEVVKLRYFGGQTNEETAQLLGISVDGSWCHAAFSQNRKLHFPLLADFEPKGAVAKLYGVYRQGEGTSERALFVIDADGVIRWSYVSPVGVNPGADGILSALEELQSKSEAK